MQTIDSKQSMGEIVAAHPHASRVFGRYGLDYCCGGKQPLSDACAKDGLDAEHIIGEIMREQRPGESTTNWQDQPLSALVSHILETHHVYTKAALRDLTPLMTKVATVHGNAHPELLELRTLLECLKADMDMHLHKEEVILFPYLAELDTGHPRQAPFGAVANPIRMMTLEHETDGDILQQMRAVTDNFVPPANACTSYRALYANLQELVDDLMRHIHLENHVLFPMAIAREQQSQQA